MTGLSLRLILLAGLLLPPAAFAQTGTRVHALSLKDQPKYGADFRQLDYVNLSAPKGGELRMAEVGSGFDSLNPFIPKGNPAPGISLTYMRLTEQLVDDESSEYGMIAESMEVATDGMSMVFNLRPEARWSDGTPITADDVIYSFDTLKEKGAPQNRFYYADVSKGEKLGPRQVRFQFTGARNRELPVIMGQLEIIEKAYWEKHDFEKTTLDPWPGSGPYRVKEVVPGRYIVYERVADWWGKDLPTSKGRYNYDRIRYDSYRDDTVALEAFKSHQFDLRRENSSRNWATGYESPALRAGNIIKEELPHHRPTGVQGFAFNIRREKFSDPRVREAFDLAFDFEWTNKNFFFGKYSRNSSYFENSEFAAHALPDAEELKLLEPYRAQLPAEVFTQVYKSPVSDGSGSDRSNLRKARELLAAAGWTIKNGKLAGPKGEAMNVEFLEADPAMERVVGPWQKNLERLGITVTIRAVDTSQYVARVRSFDFDLIAIPWGQSDSPGNEQREFWGSQAADRQGSRNYIGIKSPIVDALIEKLVAAPDRKTLITVGRALDRVLVWGHYIVPNWYLRADWYAYWNKFSHGKNPEYGPDLFAWWIDPAKEAALKDKAPEKVPDATPAAKK